MEDNCFCHLSGYECKDADLRDRITVIEQKLGISTESEVNSNG